MAAPQDDGIAAFFDSMPQNVYDSMTRPQLDLTQDTSTGTKPAEFITFEALAQAAGMDPANVSPPREGTPGGHQEKSQRTTNQNKRGCRETKQEEQNKRIAGPGKTGGTTDSGRAVCRTSSCTWTI